jgi:DNA-binding NarL/FixJ family response regulator
MLATLDPFALLSKRELEVLRLVARDRTDREIARELEIRERTVRAHVSRIILKFGVASRVGAAVVFAAWAVREEIRHSAMAERPMD